MGLYCPWPAHLQLGPKHTIRKRRRLLDSGTVPEIPPAPSQTEAQGEALEPFVPHPE